MTAPSIISGLREIAGDYDALICDVWGVIHNGARAFAPACEALKTFRAGHGPVVLVSNAPRPADDVKKQFVQYGVPEDCYDAIITSGSAARSDLERRSKGGTIHLLHIGPERDRGVYEGLDVESVDANHASLALCTGLFDDAVETPDDYVDALAELKAKHLVMLCANPDIVVQRGGELVYCAGALAKAYEEVGGAVVYYGKPHRPIYDAALEAAKRPRRALAVGDGIATDIKGANGAGLDALFIADGIHGEEVEPFTQRHLELLLEQSDAFARAAMRTLVW